MRAAGELWRMSGLVCLRERTKAASSLSERVGGAGSDVHVRVGEEAAHVRGASAGGGIEAAALEAHGRGHATGAERGDWKRSAPHSVEFGRHGLVMRKRGWRRRSSGIADVPGVVAEAGEAGVRAGEG